jgi:hypothetical protein
MLTTLIMLSIIAGLFIIASIVDRLLPHSILFPSTVTRAIKGQRDVSEYLDSLAMLDRDGPYVAGHAFDDLILRSIRLREAVTVATIAKGQEPRMDRVKLGGDGVVR